MAEEGKRYDSTALERILKRAAELQTSERDMTGSLSGEEVLTLGRDVGIPERYLKQAMLEANMATPPPAEPETLLDELVGVSEVGSSRVVRGTPRAVEEALVHYMDEEEAFRVLRRATGHISWEPLGGWAGAMRRIGSKSFMLQKADRVVATISPLEDGYVHVDLRAGLRNHRNAFAGGGAAVASLGVATTVVLAALSAVWPLLLIPMPVASGIAWVTVRQYKVALERTQLGIEVALDHLERGVRPALAAGQRPGLLDTLIREIGPRTSRP